jgi:membrane protein YqaA with SNARE-associated domain
LGSELAVGAAILSGANPWITLLIASSANTAGATLNWALGRAIERFRHRSWFPVTAEQIESAQRRFARYGQWSLLLAWVPVIGDPLTFAAGVLRVPFLPFVVLTGLGKTARYFVLIFFLDPGTA